METLPVEEHGIRMRMANFFFSRAMESMPGQMKKMVEIMAVPEVINPGLSEGNFLKMLCLLDPRIPT